MMGMREECIRGVEDECRRKGRKIMMGEIRRKTEGARIRTPSTACEMRKRQEGEEGGGGIAEEGRRKRGMKAVEV